MVETSTARQGDSSSRKAGPAETEANLRASLREQVANARFDLESRLNELKQHLGGGAAGALGQSENQLHALSRLERRIDHAGSESLAAVRAEVAAAVLAIQATTEQAAGSAAAQRAAEAGLQAASEAAHREVASFVHDFYERKIFDPYLHFSSADDEKAYRDREAERRRAIEKAEDKNMPEGNLRAAQLSIEQLKDAGAHGATASPQYQAALDQLTGVDANLSGQLAQAGRSRSDAVASKDADSIDKAAPSATIPVDVLARLKAAGVTPAASNLDGHGVAARATTPAIQGRG